MSFLFNFDDPIKEKSSSEDKIAHQDLIQVQDKIKNKNDEVEDRKQDEVRKSGDKKEAFINTALELQQSSDDDIIQKLQFKTFEFDQHLLKVVDTSHLEQLILNDTEFQKLFGSSQILQAAHGHSDLVTGSYEGGLKIWECAMDLTEFLNSGLDKLCLSIEEKRVLELGCGAGLPGLICAKRGAKSVHFQDYNEEVLKLVTSTNVTSCLENQDSKTCRYFSGDWSSFEIFTVKENLMYDIILTAETIYNVDNYEKLHSLFDATLAENGFVLLAAKSYYFGVGGSTEGFQEYVTSKETFSSEIVFSLSKGVPRYILLLKRIQVKAAVKMEAKKI